MSKLSDYSEDSASGAEIFRIFTLLKFFRQLSNCQTILNFPNFQTIQTILNCHTIQTAFKFSDYSEFIHMQTFDLAHRCQAQRCELQKNQPICKISRTCSGFPYDSPFSLNLFDFLLHTKIFISYQIKLYISNLTYMKNYDTILKKTFFNMRVPLRYSYTLPGIFPAIKRI